MWIQTLNTKNFWTWNFATWQAPGSPALVPAAAVADYGSPVGPQLHLPTLWKSSSISNGARCLPLGNWIKLLMSSQEKWGFELKSNKPFPLEEFPPVPLYLADSCHYSTLPIPPGLFTNSVPAFTSNIGRITKTFRTTRVCMNYLAKAQQTDCHQKALDYLHYAQRAPRLILEKIIQQTTHTPCAVSAINRGTLAMLMGEHLFPSFVHYLFQVIKFITSFGCTLTNRAHSVSLKLSIKHQICSVCITQSCLAENSIFRLGGKDSKRFNWSIHMTD